MKRMVFELKTPPTTCPIYCGVDIVQPLLDKYLRRRQKSVRVVIDENVHQLYYHGLLELHLKDASIYRLPSGETSKSAHRLMSILKWLQDSRADRQSLLVAIGGGVVTDLAGFAASCYMRGMSFLSIPTTLVGQVDAAIGGKTAINLGRTKNIVGTFYPPQAVICDLRFLASLSSRQLKDGIIETIKIFSTRDGRLLDEYSPRIPDINNTDRLSEFIVAAIRLKLEVVNRDPHEKNLRKVLNFGHTTGHAYEALTRESHGKSVAFGLLVVLTLSRKLVRLSQSDFQRVWDAVTAIYSKYHLKPVSAASLWEYILHDKKNKDGTPHFVLIKACGKHQFMGVEFDQFERAFEETVELLNK